MKRLTIGLVVFGGLFLASCNKEEITPNAGEQAAPEWRRAAKCDGDGPIVSGGTHGQGGTSSPSGGITDPNNDEDSNGRKKN